MKNQYETIFIMTPVLSEDQMKDAVKKFKGFLKGKKSKIVHEENWGLRKLAYSIQKKSSGFYHLFEHISDTETIGELELEFKHDERILRFLTIKMDKHHLAYAEKRKAKARQKSEEPKTEEPKEEPITQTQ